MTILPLPQFEADLEADRKLYNEKLRPPKSLVVRFGLMRMVGEFPYEGDAKPGCGSKIVLRTHRGTEIGEMLTSTCPNAGCSHSVTRTEMLAYIDNSGGKDYPFFTDGRALRVATVEDMNQQAASEARRPEMIRTARQWVQQLGLAMKIVDAEPILGGERLTFHYTSEDRIDFRPLVMELAAVYRTRIEMHQVGARDEARLTADYEKCGQHCCCRQFLKVLKPVSMRSAKIQKATLDPLKISGRCGRLMCCLRYEDSTYDELRANLPKKRTPVVTPDGPGIVIDSQILTQLVLVRLDATSEDAAYPVESLKKLDPSAAPQGPVPGDADGDDDHGPAASGPQPPVPPADRDRDRSRRLVPRSDFAAGSRGPNTGPPAAPDPTRRPPSDGRGPSNRGPDSRRSDSRGPSNRGPDNRPPGPPRPGNRGPDNRGPDSRGPDSRRPDNRGPAPRRPDNRPATPPGPPAPPGPAGQAPPPPPEPPKPPEAPTRPSPPIA